LHQNSEETVLVVWYEENQTKLQIRLDDLREAMIELSWEAIKTRGFIMFYLENYLSYSILRIL
jgi:hypothetical protein